MSLPIPKEIASEISRKLRREFHISSAKQSHGGDINQSFVIYTSDVPYFLKLNSATNLPILQTEANSLETILDTQVIRTPRPVCAGNTTKHSFLLLEYLSLRSRPSADEKLGQALAELHRNSSTQFGWYENNFIGLSPQPNNYCGDWCEFWKTNRLGFQVKLAENKGCPKNMLSIFSQLNENIDYFFQSYQPIPSLLHGDLWSGNKSACNDGTAVIYDPASYYGDRETDIAMTELFGGFSLKFYQSYNNSWPLDKGYNQRRSLYQLYHVLNHYNLFGGHYLQQAYGMAQLLLSKINGKASGPVE